GYAGGKARLERCAAGRIVSAQADCDNADLVWADVPALLQKIDAGAARLFVIVAQYQPAESKRLTGARSIHDQDGDAAPDQIGHAGEVLDFFRDIEAVEEHDAGRRRGARILRVHEVAGQACALERHLHRLDLYISKRGELVEAVD